MSAAAANMPFVYRADFREHGLDMISDLAWVLESVLKATVAANFRRNVKVRPSGHAAMLLRNTTLSTAPSLVEFNVYYEALEENTDRLRQRTDETKQVIDQVVRCFFSATLRSSGESACVHECALASLMTYKADFIKPRSLECHRFPVTLNVTATAAAAAAAAAAATNKKKKGKVGKVGKHYANFMDIRVSYGTQGPSHLLAVANPAVASSLDMVAEQRRKFTDIMLAVVQPYGEIWQDPDRPTVKTYDTLRFVIHDIVNNSVESSNMVRVLVHLKAIVPTFVQFRHVAPSVTVPIINEHYAVNRDVTVVGPGQSIVEGYLFNDTQLSNDIISTCASVDLRLQLTLINQTAALVPLDESVLAVVKSMNDDDEDDEPNNQISFEAFIVEVQNTYIQPKIRK